MDKTIWTGDRLYVMRGMNSESVDLIYLDPPFNSKANYAAPIGSKAAGAAFKDTWTLTDLDVEWINLIEAKNPNLYRVILAAMNKSDKSYLVYMATRLLEMRRILKSSGSIYLHCDPTMSHYLKLVMDSIWGRKNFLNEVIWYYRGGGVPKKTRAKRHDVLLWYGKRKGSQYFNPDPIRRPYAQATQERFKHHIGNVRATGDYGEQELNPDGKHPDDVVDYIQPVAPSANERTGYPTQKPLALLNHVILSSSKQNDIVLDPFCVCATTCVAADDLGRNWVGIDISEKAAELVVERIQERQGLFRDITHRVDIPYRTDLGNIPGYNSPANRKFLYGEQRGDCAGCGIHFELPNLETDHIISRNKGGTDHRDNLQLLCSRCNRIKGDRGMEYLMARLQMTP